MEIYIKSEKIEDGDYSTDYKMSKESDNQEICNCIATLELIKKELLDSLKFNYEVFE